jgi:hypothetical protein
MKAFNMRILVLLALPLIVSFALFGGGCEGAMEKDAEVSEGAALPEVTPDEVEGGEEVEFGIANSALLPGIYGTAYSETISGEGGSGNYVITLEGLPSGLSFSENAISGTPQEIGSFSIAIELTDFDTSETVSKNLDLLINKETPTIIAHKMSPDLWLPINEDPVEEQVDVKLLLQVQGNAPGYTWSIVEAMSNVCITKNTSDMFARDCDHPLGSDEQSNTCYVYKLPPIGVGFEFSVRVESPYSNPVEKKIKYTSMLY